MTNDELLHKWIQGELTPGELEVFRQRPEYESLVTLYENTEGLTPPAFDSEAMLSSILLQAKTPAVTSTGKRISIQFWLKAGLAASLLIIAGWFLFLQPGQSVVVESGIADQVKGSLPDQSTFVLNAQSSLGYDLKEWSDRRVVRLNGEAYFEVKKGASFTVQTGSGQVQVLGTQFNVRSRGQLLEVNCQSGKVAVLSVGGKLIDELGPGDAIRIKPESEPERWKTTGTGSASWTEGISRFYKVPLATVLDELQRQYKIEINPGTVDTTTILTCNFQHKDLESALKTTLSSLGIRYEIEDGNKVILNP